jgi:acyl-CoA thioester hydrolase
MTCQVGYEHRFPIRIYYEDTDTLGLVYHANYLKFAERARTEWLHHLSINLIFVVRRCTADFIRAARFKDDLTVVTQLMAIGGASLEFDQKIQRGEETLVKFSFQIACIDHQFRPHRLPADLRSALLRFVKD